jgi:hypothetical protein
MGNKPVTFAMITAVLALAKAAGNDVMANMAELLQETLDEGAVKGDAALILEGLVAGLMHERA